MRSLAILLVFVLLSACDSSTQRGEERRAGEHIQRLSTLASAEDLGADQDMLAVPKTVQAGEPFTITFTTHASGCIEAADVSVDWAGQVVEVMPFDQVYIPKKDEACQQYLAFVPRSTELRFDEPGAATVRLTGLKAYTNGEEFQTVERTITVVAPE